MKWVEKKIQFKFADAQPKAEEIQTPDGKEAQILGSLGDLINVLKRVAPESKAFALLNNISQNGNNYELEVRRA